MREAREREQVSNDTDYTKNKFPDFNEYLHCDVWINNLIGFLGYKN